MININRQRRFYIATAIFLLVFFTSFSASAAPQLLDFKGKPTSISDYTGNGKWLVVMLWASDCHVCNQEVHEYVAFHKKHASIKDAKVIGISLDGKQKQQDAEAFLKRHSVNFPNLIGEPVDIATMYQELTGAPFMGTPSFMVYTPDGKLLGAQGGAVPTSVIESFIERESASAPGTKTQ